MAMPVTAEDVLEAYTVIRAHVHRTPVLTCSTFDRLAGEHKQVFFKCEVTRDILHKLTPVLTMVTAVSVIAVCASCASCVSQPFQKTGSFKARGATNAIARLHSVHATPVVVTHSSGNHAQVTTWMAHTCWLPSWRYAF